jgi:hypothetical protein
MNARIDRGRNGSPPWLDLRLRCHQRRLRISPVSCAPVRFRREAEQVVWAAAGTPHDVFGIQTTALIAAIPAATVANVS